MSTPKFNTEAKEIGDRIRAAREAKKLSQADLGRLIGRTRSAIAQWENGYAMPGIPDVKIMSPVLGVEPSLIAFGVTSSRDEIRLIPLVEYADERRIHQIDSMALDRQSMTRLTMKSPHGNMKAVASPNQIGPIHKGDRLIIDDTVRSVSHPDDREHYLIWTGDRAMTAEVAPAFEDNKVSVTLAGGVERVLSPDKIHVLGKVVHRVPMPEMVN